MVIGGLLSVMMSEQEPCTKAGSTGGIMIRRRSKDWILPNSAVTNILPSGGVLASERTSSICSAVVDHSSVVATTQALSSMTAGIVAANPRNPTQFRNLIEMIFFCYLDNGGAQRSEQLRELVEALLYPVLEHASRSACTGNNNNNSNSATSLPFSTAATTTGITAVATPIMSRPLSSCGGSNECLSSSTSASPVKQWLPSAVTVPTIPSVPVTVPASGSTTKDNNVGAKEGVVTGNLLCPACYGVLSEPVTILCGHSYCKRCLQKEVAGSSCRRCNHYVRYTEATHCKTNVLLGALVEKWWPEYMAAIRLRNEGNDLFEAKLWDKAITKYNQALAMVPDDHLTLANRSNCLLTAGRSEEALQDADAAIKYCPQWPKGHFRKSCAMTSLGRYEEAFLSLTVCMYLMKLSSPRVPPSSCSSTSSTSSSSSSSSSSASCLTSSYPEDPGHALMINKMIKILQKLFLQSANAAVGSTLKRHSIGEQSSIHYTPYPGARRRGSGAPAFSRQDWNDSEYNSSGDESDHVIQTHHHQNTWKSNNRCYIRHLREQSLLRSSNTSTVVDQLSVRMSRLFTRAKQDLKSLEHRMRANSTQGMKMSPHVRVPQDVSCSDVECSLCYRLLFQPVSTECGHTFCRSCLDRCMDHNPACPLCKTGLQSYLACREHAVTEFLETAIKTFLPKEYEERLNQHIEELNSVAEGKNLDVDIPIFVCTMAFPTVPCPLHVFEPRYRLMIRRCMENGSNKFGMCCYLSDAENNYGDIGTLLEIRNIQYFADGRSVVDTVGCRRFKVVQKSIVDGYNAARIELLQDKPILESETAVVKGLHDQVFKEATEWLQSIGQIRRQRIHSHFGQMPAPEDNWMGSPDGPSWIWWLLAILPLDSKAQLAILSMCSLQKRLECILKVLNFVKNRMGSGGE